MTAKYKSGHGISANVINALRFTGKVGMITSPIWYKHFGVGNLRWRKKQLLYLIHERFLQRHSIQNLKGVWILDINGRKLLNNLGYPTVSPVSSLYIKHNEFVATSIMDLNNAGVVESWMVDAELFKQQQDIFSVKSSEDKFKFPDAVFNILVKGQSKTIAIEYEKTGKSLGRYRSILWDYAGLHNISLVIFICESTGTYKRIQAAYDGLQMDELERRFGLSMADDWIKSPLDASIKMSKGRFKLRDICTRVLDIDLGTMVPKSINEEINATMLKQAS